MGYTNYYYVPKVMEKEKFKTLAQELEFATSFIAGNHSSSNDGEKKDKFFTLHNGLGEGVPEFTEERICFNGDASKGLDHETFYIGRDNSEERDRDGGLHFEFCKTARKPYDLMVQISMLRLKHHFPESKISSDGEASDWKNARKVYKNIFKEAPPKMNRD